jgi:hypothetical protein
VHLGSTSLLPRRASPPARPHTMEISQLPLAHHAAQPVRNAKFKRTTAKHAHKATSYSAHSASLHAHQASSATPSRLSAKCVTQHALNAKMGLKLAAQPATQGTSCSKTLSVTAHAPEAHMPTPVHKYVSHATNCALRASVLQLHSVHSAPP